MIYTGCIYLDHNATTPPHPEVLEAMKEAWQDGWANPSSIHRPGQRARALLDDARLAVGELVGRHHRDVVLTSGGTEANNLGLWQPFVDGAEGRGLVVSRVEHPSIVQTAEAIAARGGRVVWVAPAADGRVPIRALVEAMEQLGPSLAMVTLQAVNHETGVIQPVAELLAEARRREVLVHVDAVQALGKLEPQAWRGADSVALAAHKIRGPKGIGALVGRAGLTPRPLLRGGAQERGVRPGTQGAALAAGFAVAARRAWRTPDVYRSLAPLRDQLEQRLQVTAAKHGVVVSINGTAPRVHHVSNTSWQGWQGAELCAALDLEGVAVSSGSACSAGTAEPSAVIRAMLGEERARSAMRISFGETTRDGDVDGALSALERVLERGAVR
jgi:cysteine desulfurase